MELLQHLRIGAHANRLANHRLYAALAALAPQEFHAPRTSFFPSLAQTLNHILAVDGYYLDALEGVAAMVANHENFVAAETVQQLEARQRKSDERLIAYCERLTDPDAAVAMDRGEGKVQRDRAAHVLAHLYMHQTHHRGQVHAMLSGTAIKPPQLDEFLMPSDAPFREAEMRELGWREDEVYR